MDAGCVFVCRPEQVQQPYYTAQEPGSIPGHVVRNRCETLSLLSTLNGRQQQPVDWQAGTAGEVTATNPAA